MRKSLRMDVVKPSQYLFEVITTDSLLKGTCVENVVEEFTAQDGFLRNICDWYELTTALFPDRCFSELVILNYVFII